jgi:hypothetical protein
VIAVNEFIAVAALIVVALHLLVPVATASERDISE